MEKINKTVDLDWQIWKSTSEDVDKIPLNLSRHILFEIFLINAFERAVMKLKADDCVHGPIHISIGQEGLAAAVMASLRDADLIAGSHRAHHQFIAKIMNHALPGNWDPTREDLPDAGYKAVRHALAEIMGLAPGYCGGRGGSMHLRSKEAGVLGTNAIVCGGVPLATGAALAEQRKGDGNIVIAFFGDGGIPQGSFHEAANLAGLWNLPIIYLVENNQYAVATSVNDACAVSDLAQHAASYDMNARTIYGYDVPGIYCCIKEAVDSLRNGGKPFLIEANCYRHLHHGGDMKGSAFGYRSKEEEEEWKSKDAYTEFPAALISNGMLTEKDVERVRDMAEATVEGAVDFCTTRTGNGEEKFQVKAELWPHPSTASEGLHSDGKELEDLPYREREDFTSFVDMKYSDAIAAVTGHWMERDSTVIELGEEIANMGGGAYGATKGLPRRFPEQIINTPISECGFSGVGLGAAMNGMKSIIEIMFPDFTLVAADQIFNQIAKARHMYGGTTDLPLVLRARVATGCGYGGQHSMDPVGLYALFPGWRIAAPSDSFEFIGLFNTAMHSLDPVILLEHNALYTQKLPVPEGDLDYCIPFGKARVVREGSDITVLVYGIMVQRLEKLAEEFEAQGVKPEIIDLRTLDLKHMDWETIGESVEKTNIVVTVEEAAGGQSIGRRVTSEITEKFFDLLDAPPGVLTSLDIPNPVSRMLESAALLDDETILSNVVAMARREWK